jgi:endoglucanase
LEPEHLHRARRLRPAAFGIALAIMLAVLGHASSRADAAPLSISISGNHFVNGSGQAIRLLGVNHPSSEYACVDGFGYNDGHQDDADAAAIASWNASAVRVPINEDCWLGINGQPSNSQNPGQPFTASGYQQAVESYVSELNAHGLYAILDLHWTAPGSEIAAEQQPMPDAHSQAFWASLANTFKDNHAVVFDLFNEPFDPTDPHSGDDAEPQDKVSWECWDIGGCDTAAYGLNGKGETERTATKYQVVGMQTLVNTVRSAGATQPVMLGGLNFADDLTQWAAHAPNDPANQEAASFHNYMGLEKCDNVACWNSEIAPIAASVPVVTGEFDEDNYTESKCANKAPSTFDQDYMNWADQHGVSYLAWGWVVLSQEEKDVEGCSAFYLIEDYGGTPAFPNGTLLHDHLLTLPPGGLTTTTTTGTSPGRTNTPGVDGRPAPAVALRFLKEAVRVGGASVAFTLRSPENCSGTLTGQTLNTYAVTTVKHKRRHVSLGSVHFALKAGKAKTVVLTLSKTSRKLLAAKHALKVRITVTLTSAGHRKTVIVRTLTLKRPVRHRHGGH